MSIAYLQRYSDEELHARGSTIKEKKKFIFIIQLHIFEILDHTHWPLIIRKKGGHLLN